MGRIIRLLREALQSCRNYLQEDLIEEDAHIEVIYHEVNPIGIIVIFDGKNITEHRAEIAAQIKWLN